MKAIRHTLSRAVTTTACAALLLLSVDAAAAVQYRIAFDNASNSYAVYMTPDSIPSPDMLLSAQVTVVVPHLNTSQPFAVENIASNVNGVNWMNHSRVDAPTENTQGDYVSLGYYFSGTTAPAFGWVAGQEKKILSFTSPQGCMAGVKLMDNQDPFNTATNSAGTNPGNDFVNLGWQVSNAYTGNYGGAVTCGCDASQDQATLDTIAALEQRAKTTTNISTKQMIANNIQRLRDTLVCK